MARRGPAAAASTRSTRPGRAPARTARWQYAEAGGLISDGQNQVQIYRRAAEFVDEIFKGARPADLPVEQPVKLEPVINRRTARALGITIPTSLLIVADKVIE